MQHSVDLTIVSNRRYPARPSSAALTRAGMSIARGVAPSAVSMQATVIDPRAAMVSPRWITQSYRMARLPTAATRISISISLGCLSDNSFGFQYWLPVRRKGFSLAGCTSYAKSVSGIRC